MTTALVLYGSTVSATTLANACKLSITTGGTTANTTTTCTDGTSSHFWYMEVWSKGGSNGDVATLPAPTGKGYLYDSVGLEGQIISSGNWATTVRIDDSVGFASVDLIIRAYIYNGGTYTAICTMTAAGVALTSTSTNYTTAASSTAAKTFGTGDKLYVDFWVFANGAGGHWNLDPIRTFTSSNGAAGIANQFVITTPGYVPAATTVTKTLQSRLRLATQKSLTLGIRLRERVQRTLTLQTRFVLQPLKITKTLVFRFLERVQATKTLQVRFLERTIASKTLQSRFLLRTQKSLTLAIRFLERVTKTTTLQFRTLIRTQKTLTLPVRFVMRKYTMLLKFRVLIRSIATKTLQVRARIATTVTRNTLPFRALIRTTRSLTLPFRTVIRTIATRTLQARLRLTTKRTMTLQARIRLQSIKTATLQFRALITLPSTTKTLQTRLRLRSIRTATLTFRLRLSGGRLLSGGAAIFANGTGTATFDSLRVNQYPDPALSLAPIIPRIGATSIEWNALTPTNTTLGMDISLDGITWTDVTAGNGASIPGIFSQPDPTIDGFDTNTAANYTSTFRTGGSATTPTFNTFNSRLILTGGVDALYLYTAITDNDVDFFVDMDYSDFGGMVWRYVDANNFYYLSIVDTLSQISTPNRITLYKVVGGVLNQVGVSQITYTIGSPQDAYTTVFTRGTYHRFRVTMLLGVITVYVDGQQLITYTDGSPLGVGKMGLYNGGGTSRYYQLWMTQIGDVVTGSPAGDIVTGKFVYTRARLATTDASVTPQVLDLTTLGVTPDISMGTLIPNITYNAAFLNANFDDLAKQSNFFWYFKPDRSFVFRAMSTIAAPWILQSSTAGLVNIVDLKVDSNLELDVANDLYRNRQTILGAQDTISPPAAAFIGDGQSTTFTLGYPLASIPTLTLNGITQTVGLKGTTGSNWYYAVNDAVLEQDSNGVVMEATDQLVADPWVGLFDIVITVDDTVEQAARALIEGGTGITESVEDHTGENMRANAAITLAAQLINRYAIAGRTLIFSTSRDGLAIGQTLTIFLPEHGLVDAQLIINNIEITLKQGLSNTQVYLYKVTCSELPHQNTWSKLIAAGLGLS